MDTITYGLHTLEIAKLPPASVDAILSRGFTHYFGNEQASKVTAKIKRAIVGDDGDVGTVDRDAVKAYRESNADAVTAWTAEAVANAVKALTDGTVGVRAVGEPKANPEDALVKRLAQSEVIAALIKQGVVKEGAKSIKSDQEFVFGKDTDSPRTTTFGALVARKIELHSDRLHTEAKKELDRLAREAAKKAAAAAPSDLDELMA